MGKATKQTKKFQKRHLKRAIDDRKTYQKKKAAVDRAKQAKDIRSAKKRASNRYDGLDEQEEEDSDSERDEDEDEQTQNHGGGNDGFQGMSVEEFLGGGFKTGMEDDSEDEDDGGDGSEAEDDLSDLDDVSDGEMHAQDLEQLKSKDPDFYKYLQENDSELLNFGEDSSEDGEGAEDEEASDAEMQDARAGTKIDKGKGRATETDLGDTQDSGRVPAGQQVVTMPLLRSWQKAMVRQHSLKALRKLLLAFRAAAHMDDPDATSGDGFAFAIEEATVFNKLLLTVLKYTPAVLQHHIPARENAQGKFKLPTNSKKFSLLQRPIQTYFTNLHHLLSSLSEQDMIYVAVNESARMVPFLMNNRRMARDHLKLMLDLWATASDRVRIAAFLSIRKMARAGDEAMLEMCLRGTYQSFIRSTKLTTVHTLPSINLMKNSSSELYSLDSSAAYQQAFSFIRQLAIHLRNALKTRSAESFKSVYNWQYIHCVDFWSIVLATACDTSREDSELKQLIYPLVQVATGAIRLIPTSRYFPLRMHLLRSMLRLMQRTGVYVPLAPSLLEMLSAPEFTRKPKGSTLKPLDFRTTLRAPAAYVRTRVYADQLAEEVPHLLLEFFATQSRCIALPELIVPVVAQLRRSLKHGTSPKLASTCKQLLAKVESNATFIKSARDGVDFAPNDSRGVNEFLADRGDKFETALEGAQRLARKVRDQKRRLVEAEEHVV